VSLELYTQKPIICDAHHSNIIITRGTHDVIVTDENIT